MPKSKHVAEAHAQFTPQSYANMVHEAVSSIKLEWPGTALEISVHPDIHNGDVYRHKLVVALYAGRESDGVIVNKTVTPQNGDTPDKVIDLACRLIIKAFNATVERRLHRTATVPLTVSAYPKPSAIRLSA